METGTENGNHGPGTHTQYGQSHSVYKSDKFVVNITAASKYIPKRVTSDAIKIEPKAEVKHYCFWFDFYFIRR